MRHIEHDAVYIIRTPLHYLNALEAASHYGYPTEKAALIIQYSQPALLAATRRLADEAKWYSVSAIRVPLPASPDQTRVHSIVRSAMKCLKVRSLNRLARSLAGCSMCCTAMYSAPDVRHLVNRLGGSRLIIIDEGIGQMNHLADMKRSLASTRNGVRRRGILSTLTGYDPSYQSSYELFSSLRLPGWSPGSYVQHSFQRLRQQFAGFPRTTVNEAMLLGKPHSSFGGTDAYMAIVRSAANFLRNRGHSLVYVPHRGEHITTVRRPIEQAGFVLRNFGEAVELALLKRGAVPKCVAGFASTAIETLRVLFPEEIESLISFHVKNGTERWLRQARVIYDYFEAIAQDDRRVEIRGI